MPIESDTQSAMRAYSAVFLGATGNVGRQIVNLLVASPAAKEVVLVSRRQADEFKGIPKVRAVVVPDMIGLEDAAEHAAKEAGATIGFCTIGIGKGSWKMPSAQVRRIEVEYPGAFARGCKVGGVLSLGLMTAAGADISSWSSFARIIGEKEAAVIDAGIPSLGIYKPSVIYGNSNTPAYIDRIFPVLERLLPSPFHGIHNNDLARAMFEGTQKALVELEQKRSRSSLPDEPEVKSYVYDDMKAFFRKDDRR